MNSSTKSSLGKKNARARFGLACSFLAPLRSLIQKISYQHKRLKRSAVYGKAIAELLATAVDGVYPNVFIRHEKVRFCRGCLPDVPSLSGDLSASTLRVSWEMSQLLYEWRYCQVVVLLYNEEEGVFLLSDSGLCLRDLQAAFELPARFLECRLHVYFMYHSAQTSKSSTSQYLGCFTQQQPIHPLSLNSSN